MSRRYDAWWGTRPEPLVGRRGNGVLWSYRRQTLFIAVADTIPEDAR